jgi:hypothetical protein
MRVGKTAITVAVVTAIIAGGLIVPADPAAADPAWSITPTPNPSGASKTMWNGVSCPSTSNCFAVGRANGKAIAARKRGGAWAITFRPNVVKSVLNEIACPTTTSCFAVGSRSAGPNLVEAFIVHWNSRSWSIMRVPNVVDAALHGVSCRSRWSCTAVGTRGSRRTLVERWNGKKWSVVPSPSPGDNSELNAVSCPGTSRCFAVGSNDGRYGRSV